jgi:chromodomain-helicase-DNA-binding protein 4
LRRSTRVILHVTKPVKKLPFSPRKTRSRKVYVSDHSDDEEPRSTSGSEAGERAPLRRSTRTRTATKARKADSDDFSDEGSENSDTSDREPSRKVPKRKRAPGTKFVRRAAYGRVRSVVDLEYDSQSDEETAPLRVHRSTCERCHRKPTHKLLEAERKKPKGKKKVEIDKFEDEGDEDEKLAALGGWLRW